MPKEIEIEFRGSKPDNRIWAVGRRAKGRQKVGKEHPFRGGLSCIERHGGKGPGLMGERAFFMTKD